jgi:predicted ATP-grasp superfamily ATP-dependent carboligase
VSALRWESKPQLHQPVLIAAFDGWTDAGGAATGAVTYLSRQWGARQFAEIEAEDFYDFTQRRPQVVLSDDLSRAIVWPINRFLAASNSAAPDVIIMIGTEPHLKWKAFSECVTAVATELQVQTVFTVGAMLGQVVHTRPAPVRISSADPGLADQLGLQRPQYQGPTGIVGVLQDAFATVAIPAGSIMAQVPHYIPGTPSPKATLAIIQRLGEVLQVPVSTGDLEQAAATYERQVNEAVATDDDMVGYVRELERRLDDAQPADGENQLGPLPSTDTLVAQLEEYLREQDPPTH